MRKLVGIEVEKIGQILIQLLFIDVLRELSEMEAR